MGDKELLELAAKAAGDLVDGPIGPVWNPLNDDGDALRLAVSLGIGMVHHLGWGQVFHPKFDGERIDFHYDPDAQTAMRRAIVRAAAELGKMES
ncbi:TPA: hypothetical protein QDC06_004585 [Burkholderia cepacia]|nr:hypothetical protein BZY94_31000 [Burkholderia territorii]HDR9501289.1 hypothetical protein [Burkholderia cepacia]